MAKRVLNTMKKRTDISVHKDIFTTLKPKKENAKYAGHKRYQNYQACSQCPVKDKCTVNKQGRTIQDRPFQRFADEEDKRTTENADIYKKRQRLAEHPFGSIKRGFGFSYFLT
jgi:hypothetical protein